MAGLEVFNDWLEAVCEERCDSGMRPEYEVDCNSSFLPTADLCSVGDEGVNPHKRCLRIHSVIQPYSVLSTSLTEVFASLLVINASLLVARIY